MVRMHLLKEVRQVITEVYLKHPNWKTRKIHEEVVRQVQQRIQWAEPGWPGLSVVQKELAKIRKRDDTRPLESKKLDNPWTLGSLAEYEIPQESLPLVMSIYEKLFRANKESEFTIRRVLWMARLQTLFEMYLPQHVPPDVWGVMLQEASRQNNISQGNIGRCLAKTRPSAGGYIWTYKPNNQ